MGDEVNEEEEEEDKDDANDDDDVVVVVEVACVVDDDVERVNGESRGTGGAVNAAGERDDVKGNEVFVDG